MENTSSLLKNIGIFSTENVLGVLTSSVSYSEVFLNNMRSCCIQMLQLLRPNYSQNGNRPYCVNPQMCQLFCEISNGLVGN